MFCQVCFEKRLVISHDLSEPGATAAAYGELGVIHRMLGHFEQSVSEEAPWISGCIGHVQSSGGFAAAISVALRSAVASL